MKNHLKISSKHQAIFNITKYLLIIATSLITACKNHDSSFKTKNQSTPNQDNSNYSSCVPANYNLGNFDKEQIAEYYKCRQDLAHKNFTTQKQLSTTSKLEKCLEDARVNIINQRLNQKISCEKKSLEIFPNSLSFENNIDNEEKRLYLKRVKLGADYTNFNNFIAIGIDDDAFGAAEQKDAKPTKTKRPTTKGIYSISEINQLRYDYLLKCYENLGDQIIKSNNDLTNECYKQFK